jgi:hypothetical protein
VFAGACINGAVMGVIYEPAADPNSRTLLPKFRRLNEASRAPAPRVGVPTGENLRDACSLLGA